MCGDAKPRRSMSNTTLLSGTKDLSDHPWFRGALSRFFWRFYTERMSPGARWLIWPTLAIAAYAGASLELQGHVLFVYVLMFWVVAFGASYLFKPRNELHLVHGPYVRAGETLEIQARLTRPPRFHAVWSLVPHRLPMSIDSVGEASFVETDPAESEAPTARLRLRCARRGLFILKGFRLQSEFPLGLFRTSRVLGAGRRIIVLPAFVPLLECTLGETYDPSSATAATGLASKSNFISSIAFTSRVCSRKVASKLGGYTLCSGCGC